MSDVTLSGVEAAPPGYDLFDEVGHGGMGVVYRARDLALDREVAVKILHYKHAPDSATAARFVAEARITGQLQHPGIPAVYHVGTLADGRPFLAMKLIKGRTLDSLLETRDLVDPLAVFEAVSQAVGYAHAHDVIHRDLKPANVMVGAFGEVQVMDWGLAKVLTASRKWERPRGDPNATTAATVIRSQPESETPLTQYGSVLGTPAYMAPEQAAGELDKVDARSDVFGLGAILCVLLTGRPPFEGKDAESVRLNAVRGRTEEAFARLDDCAADPDVVALCKRCLAFEPADRPATADEVAAAVAGLRRAADERAKQAERERLEAEVRAAEEAKRRRAVLWGAVAVAAVLLVGVAGTTIGLVRANAARRDAQAAQRQAEAKEAEANAVVKFFEAKVLAAARPRGQHGGLGKDATLRDAIVASLPALAGDFKDQPLVEARLRRALSITFRFLGDPRTAAEQAQRARALYVEQLGPDHPDTLAAMHELANSYHSLDRHADALDLNTAVLAARKRVLGPDHKETLKSMNNLANDYHALGRFSELLALRQETLAAAKRVLGPDDRDMLGCMHNLGTAYEALGRMPEALAQQQETLAAYKRVLGPDDPDTLRNMQALAYSYLYLGRHTEALKLYEELLAANRRVLPPDHRDSLAYILGFGEILELAGRAREALPRIEEALAAASKREADPGLGWFVLLLRVRAGQLRADPAAVRAAVDKLAAFHRTDLQSLWDLGRATARLSATVRAADPSADGQRAADADAAQAVAVLQKAVAAGATNYAMWQRDPGLGPIRSRADFQALLASIRPKPTQPSAPK
jgi:tetratricopeptide (TPR) repeat protein